ncbi:ricin B lectin domain-containing protein [Dichomitus squalens]|nr:ricin B lectin domain-containing protein [Dichomitus squalens]
MAASIIENGVYFIQNFSTGTVINLKDGSNNTRVQTAKKLELDVATVSEELWIITRNPNKQDEYMIQNAGSGTYMDVLGGTVTNGSNIVGFKSTGDKSQGWLISRNVDNKTYVIANAVTGKHYVTLSGGDTSEGKNIQVYAGEGTSETDVGKLWLIVRA